MPYRDWQKAAAQIRQLERLRRRVAALEQALQHHAAVPDAGPTDEEGSR